MTATLDELTKTTLELDRSDRAELAARLLMSLDEPSEDEVERLWQQEASRRLEAYRRGESRAIPADEVLRRAVADLS